MDNKAWTTLDETWIKAVSEVPDMSRRGVEIAEVGGMHGRGEWHICHSNAEYTHTDGKTYRFSRSFRGGSGNETNRCFYFTPDGACTVTVVYASKPGRPVKICMGGSVLASGTKEISGSKAASIFADITEPDGEVYIYGGACDKDIYGIFIDYFDPAHPPKREPVKLAYKPQAFSLGEGGSYSEPDEGLSFTPVVPVGAGRSWKTPAAAIAAIRRMTRPAGEQGRVKIVIDPGIYPGQLIIDTPYVTLAAADKNDRPVMQWHYAVGYVYYSARGGFYDAERAAARDTKGAVDMWGPVCRVAAEHVRINECIFKNTFNCEITKEEVADGCEAAKYNEYSDVNEKPERQGCDPMKKESTERAAAIALDADYTTLSGCDFISSQDTFYVNGVAYVKDCYIEGVTDYIFGGSSAVFEGCTLAWHGYTDKAVGGYISASRTEEKYNGKPDQKSNGFLFKDCIVTTSKYYPDNVFTPGAWGRNWGGDRTHAVFDGIRVKGIAPPSGWYELGGTLDNSIMYVNNVTDEDGNAIDVSGREHNPNGTMQENGYKLMGIDEYIQGIGS